MARQASDKDWSAYGVFLTVDIVLVADVDQQPHVLLIQRSNDSDAYPGCWALPGGYVDPGERIEHAARRELAEETGLTAPASWRQVGIYDDPGRDPRGRVVSVVYTAILPDAVPPTAGDDAREARWMPLADVLDRPDLLAFDHHQILTAAVDQARHHGR